MNVLLLQLDGTLPNLALMRIAAHHRARGDTVVLRQVRNAGQVVQGELGDLVPERVYASLIFERTRPLAELVLRAYGDRAELGGTGWDRVRSLMSVGIPEGAPDYSDHPDFRPSLGFTQRGCRLRCPFCVVPAKEGAVRGTHRIADIWRGEPWPRDIILLDNDFFGQPEWRLRIEELRGFRVNFNQGINARTLTDDAAAALASTAYYDVGFHTRRLYTAWDNLGDEERLFAGLSALVRHGVRPDHIMVYMLVGYWPRETAEDREHRRRRLREFGARPYPMPYVRTRELVGFQRWVVGAYDKRVAWADWERAGYNPRRLGLEAAA